VFFLYIYFFFVNRLSAIVGLFAAFLSREHGERKKAKNNDFHFYLRPV